MRSPFDSTAVATGTSPAFAVAAAVALLLPSSLAASVSAAPREHVIVQALPGAVADAERAVVARGGSVDLELKIINGFAATVPAHAALGHAEGVLAVSPDRAMRLSAYDGATDAGAPVAVQSQIGANTFYQNGYYGSGVGVALIDSGIVPQDGLKNNVYYGPDFTSQVNDPTLRFLDTFGHGTFMAGLISGRTSAATRPYTNPANFTGVAPEATLVSIKVADDQGNTQESAVVAAVDWAAEHKTDTNLNIRVINLSVGIPDTGYGNDPLAAAVERAWSYGITVVSSVGNDSKPGVTLPAADPFVLAVGSLDSKNTPSSGDDAPATFSNSGTAARNPDLVAPGTHIVSLRDAGSYVDTQYASTGAISASLFRGSGTSQSSAITAGAAALLISQRPTITPDQVKKVLTSTARPVAGAGPDKVGAGALNLSAAFSAQTPTVTPPTYAHAAGFNSFTNALWGGSWSGNVWQSPGYTAPANTLLSKGKPATASSTENAAGNPASYAVDGNSTTRWSSAFSDNQWLSVDLGSKFTISSVALNWEAAYAKSFQIQTSTDNVNWTTIYTTTTGSGGQQTLDVDGSGRYVRMVGSLRGTPYGYSLWEMGVYGNTAPPPCGTTDAALNRPATASSVENASLPASAAVDGNASTRWSSAWADAQWLTVDLGVTKSICTVSLNWERASATAFQMQTSADGSTWTTIYSTTTSVGGLQNLPVSGAGRYLRLVGSSRSTGYGYSLWAMSVYTVEGAPDTTVGTDSSGGTLSGSHWTGQRWTGVTWTGSHWTDASWSATSWK